MRYEPVRRHKTTELFLDDVSLQGHPDFDCVALVGGFVALIDGDLCEFPEYTTTLN